ncbi:MAG TPA: helix-turn-helix domain-containing protein [Solirubrobacterales bacterium]|nr:helix-turn-helix domain-containing protein [Solirubrobacterales bacterium]
MRAANARSELCVRLRSRRTELEAALATRVYALADPSEVGDPDYVGGLRAALVTAIDYGLDALEVGERRSPAIPPALLAQARAAARSGVGLETVLSRYFAGYTLLLDFSIEEADAGGLLDKVALRELLRGQGVVFERLIAEVSADYRREASGRLLSNEQRRAERVRRLLAGELIDSTDLAYELEDWHIAVVAGGTGAGEALAQLASSLDRRPLLIRRDDGTVWGWLGARKEVDQDEAYEQIAEQWSEEMRLAVGEPAKGAAGWRLSHRQARMAYPLSRPRQTPVVRYGEVALAASILQDDLLSRSLRQMYLDPLGEDRDGGRCLRATLRAYFTAERNVSSTAAALTVSRQTVRKRLERVEALLGRDIRNCASELEAALRLEEMGASSPGPLPREVEQGAKLGAEVGTHGRSTPARG